MRAAATALVLAFDWPAHGQDAQTLFAAISAGNQTPADLARARGHADVATGLEKR